MQYISRVIWDMILAVLKGILHECFIDTINVEYGLPHSLCVMGGAWNIVQSAKTTLTSNWPLLLSILGRDKKW